MTSYSDNDHDNHIGDTIGPDSQFGGSSTHLGDTIGPNDDSGFFSPGDTVVAPEDTFTARDPEDTLTAHSPEDTLTAADPADTLTQTAALGTVAGAYDTQAVGTETTIGGQPGSSSIFDTARLAGGVILGQKKRVFTFTRNLFLVASGLVLGVGIALTASYKSEPIANASQFGTNKVISVAVQNPTAPVEENELVVEDRLKELENWFDQQPVPVKERVFLHRAKESLKSRSVDFQAPVAVSSRFSNAQNTPINKKVEGKDGRYIADEQNGIEWQGDFEISNPSKNKAKAAKYLEELNENFGLPADAPLQKVTKKESGSLLKGAEQRSFGPKVK